MDVMQINFGESEHPVFRASGALDRGFLRNKKRWNMFRCTSAVTRQMQSSYVAQSSHSISLVFTEQSRIGVKNWRSKSQVSHLEASRNRLQK